MSCARRSEGRVVVRPSETLIRLSEADLYCETVWSFGFPLLNIATLVRNHLLAKQNKRNAYIDQYDQSKRIVASGSQGKERIPH